MIGITAPDTCHTPESRLQTTAAKCLMLIGRACPVSLHGHHWGVLHTDAQTVLLSSAESLPSQQPDLFGGVASKGYVKAVVSGSLESRCEARLALWSLYAAPGE